jgi:5'-nucleotidase / UDP-sugar diphosphatase
MKPRILLKLISGLALLLIILVQTRPASASTDALQLTILHINDPHAHYIPYSKKGSDKLIGGFAKAQTIVTEQKNRSGKDGGYALLLMAGDLLTGTPFSAVFKGKLGVALMNEMGFDAMTVGNHEFDYGQENLLSEMFSRIKFPLLSANIKTNKGKNLFNERIVREIPGHSTRIVILGLTTAGTPIATLPSNVEGLVFEDPVASAISALQEFSEKDLVIALTHLGVEEDKKLAGACPKIDIIIGGHSHTALFRPLRFGKTIICQAGAYAEYVGKLVVNVRDGEVEGYAGELVPLGPGVAEDTKIASIIETYKGQMNSVWRQAVGRTSVFLEGTRSVVRSDKPSNLGKLTAYNMALNSGTDAALLNAGAIRESINAGEITLTDVFTALPFSDTIVKLDIRGSDLQRVLQRSLDLKAGSGGKLQSFGIKYAVEKGKIIISEIQGKKFEPDRYYSLAINNFLAEGGDGYSIFRQRGKNIIDTGALVNDVIVAFFKRQQNVTPEFLEGLNQ